MHNLNTEITWVIIIGIKRDWILVGGEMFLPFEEVRERHEIELSQGFEWLETLVPSLPTVSQQPPPPSTLRWHPFLSQEVYHPCASSFFCISTLPPSYFNPAPPPAPDVLDPDAVSRDVFVCLFFTFKKHLGEGFWIPTCLHRKIPGPCCYDCVNWLQVAATGILSRAFTEHYPWVGPAFPIFLHTD